MKPLYDGEADRDDHLLQQAIEDKIVPPGCQLGGAMVQGISASGGDPCSACDIDRDACGGRPKAAEKAPPSHPLGFDVQRTREASINDSATARKHQRQLTIMQLNKMSKEGRGP